MTSVLRRLSVAASSLVLLAAGIGGPAAAATPAPSTSSATCAASTLDTLTRAQRIGQLFMIGIGNSLSSAERAALTANHYGSVTFTAKTTAGVTAVRAVSDGVQTLATRTATGKVRFFVAANQEGGLVQALNGPGFEDMPTALDQGKSPTSELRQSARRWGGDLRHAGVNLDLAPVADVVPAGTASQNAPIGQLKREFGHTPSVVSSHVKAFLVGMQRASIGTSVKHFPGLGRVRGNTDYTAAVKDTVTTRHDPYLAPFQTAIDAGVPMVMVSLATYTRIDDAHLAAFSSTVIKGMLRGDLDFKGVVMSDDLAAVAVASIAPGTRALQFIKAGGDMIISTSFAAAAQMTNALATEAASDPAFRHRIDVSVLRILRAKAAAGLLALRLRVDA